MQQAVNQILAGNAVYKLASPPATTLAAMLGIPEEAWDSERITAHEIQIVTDHALSANDEDFGWRLDELLELSPSYALAVLEVRSAAQLGSLSNEVIAGLMRQEDPALRLATMSIVGRRGRGDDPPAELGHSESLGLRKARRYVHARIYGPQRGPGRDPADVREGVEIVDRERQCTSCGDLFLRHEAGAGRDFMNLFGGMTHDCPEARQRVGPSFLRDTYRDPVLVGHGTKKPEPAWPRWMLEEGGFFKQDMEDLQMKLNSFPVLDLSAPRTRRFAAVQLVDIDIDAETPAPPPSSQRKGFRSKPGTRPEPRENAPWPMKLAGSGRLDRRDGNK